MKNFSDFIFEDRSAVLKDVRNQFPDKKQFKWNGNPTIGWWRDKNSLLFYHGTHIDNLSSMIEHGIRAPSSGPTAGWVSLALEPNTARGYASMGGESGFRAAGAAARTIPANERVVLVLRIPRSTVEHLMEKDFRGNVPETRTKLTDKSRYEAWTKTDQEYYALTEIRFPRIVDSAFIIGYMVK